MIFNTVIYLFTFLFLMAEEHKSFGFAGRMGFIMATAGSAVGLGNIWRFPYLAAEYGGGAFIFIYVILAVTFGFSLMVAEVTLGRRTGKSCFEAFASINKKWKFLGYLAILVPIIIVPYYCVIGGWITKYFVEYATGNGDIALTNSFFSDYIGCNISGLFDSPVVWFLIFAVFTIVIVLAGVEKGIERVSKVLLPMLLILLVVITIFSLTLPGAMAGLGYYLIPDFGNVNANTFLAAVGQLFYSMSLASGITITYGAYMKKDTDIEKSVRSVSLIDTSVALLAGMMVVPAVIAIGGSVNSGPGLMFETLPHVFDAMPFGDIFATLFFLLVIFAALTSSISLTEAIVHAIVGKTKLSRTSAVMIVALIILVFGMLSCLGSGPLAGVKLLGLQFLDFFDFLSNSIGMPVVAILTCIFVGHIVGTKFITDEVESSGLFKSKKMFIVMIKWICPIGLVLILITGLMSFFGIMTI